MRFFRFLSKFTFICNIAFLLFVFFRWMELRKPVKQGDSALPVPFLKDLIITLGFSAIIINLLMNVFFVMLLLRGKLKGAVLLPAINFLFLLLQIYYFFFY